MSLKDNLIAAKALIDTPEKWGVGGASFMPGAADAPLCILGACLRADKPGHYGDLVDALRPHLPTGNRSFIDFNDAPSTTHADIMALFDRAINAASIDSLDAAIAECAKPLPRHA